MSSGFAQLTPIPVDVKIDPPTPIFPYTSLRPERSLKLPPVKSTLSVGSAVPIPTSPEDVVFITVAPTPTSKPRFTLKF